MCVQVMLEFLEETVPGIMTPPQNAERSLPA